MRHPVDELMWRNWDTPFEYDLDTATSTQHLQFPPWPETWPWFKQQEPNTDPLASESDESGTDENWYTAYQPTPRMRELREPLQSVVSGWQDIGA